MNKIIIFLTFLCLLSACNLSSGTTTENITPVEQPPESPSPTTTSAISPTTFSTARTATPSPISKPMSTSTASLEVKKIASPVATPTPAPIHTSVFSSTETIDWETVYSEIVEEFTSFNSSEAGLSTKNFLTVLNNDLNSGEIKLTELPEWLDKQRFVVIEHYQTDALFGNNRRADVFQIEPEGSVNHSFNANQVGTVVVISQTEQGEYLLTTLEPSWNFNQRGAQTIFVDDYNGNGKIDIARTDLVWGHRGCAKYLSIFEWQDASVGEFVNIAENVEGIFGGYDRNDCGDEVWTFEGNDIIETYSYGFLRGDCLPYQVQTRYIWQDNSYVETETAPVDFDDTQPSECAISWASKVMMLDVPEAEFQDKAVALLAHALENWSENFNDIWGPSAEDYFRFKLGTWYALRGEKELAQTTLEQVYKQPTNKEYVLASQLAGTYLDIYQKTGDVQAACKASIELAQSAVPTGDEEIPADVDFQDSLEKWIRYFWGFAEGVGGLFLISYDWNYICNIEATAPQ